MLPLVVAGLLLWATTLAPACQAAEYALLKNVADTSLCLHIKDNSVENGAALDLKPCDPSSAAQVFDVTGWETYTSTMGVAMTKGGRCLTGPFPINGADGIRLTMYDCNGSAQQKWKTVGGNVGAAFQLQGSSGKCLTSESAGVYVDQWSCGPLASATHQFFTLQRLPGADYAILQNLANPGKCLHVKGDVGQNGAELELAPCDLTSVGQLFDVTGWSGYGTAAGYAQTKSGRCVTLYYPVDQTNGRRPIMFDCTGRSHQKWKTANGDVGGAFQLLGNNKLCLAAEGGGSYVDQWACAAQASAPQQYFRLKRSGGVEFAVLRNVLNKDKCLHIIGDSLANGAELELQPCNAGSSNQLFSSGSFLTQTTTPGTLQTKSGRCITGPYPPDTSPGVRLIMWDCTGASHQNWRLTGGTPFSSPLQLRGSNNQCLTPEPPNSAAVVGLYVDQFDCRSLDFAPHQWFTVEAGGGASTVIPPPPPPPPFQCLGDHAICSIENNACCDGFYCQGFTPNFWCRACKPEGDTCGSSELAQQCCSCCSCRDTADPNLQTCQSGGCSKLGESCTKPCCAGLTCGDWHGGSVCRPYPPTCAGPQDYSGCPGNGMGCCAGRCSQSDTVYDNSGETRGGILVSHCDCASVGYACLDDSYCCSGLCSIKFRCM